MLSLSEVQSQFRAAVVSPDDTVPSMLRAPVPVGDRLEIYRRHFREALVRHIAGRFPTVEWLLGSPRLWRIAERYVRAFPPSAPCMAEYGDGFIPFLAGDSEAAGLPYLAGVAALDWHLGNVSVAVTAPALAIASLAACPADRLPDCALRLQPGTRYLKSEWPVDDLVRIRLSEQSPASLDFTPQPVALEISGARGTFQVGRLDAPTLAFRAALLAGRSLGEAVGESLAIDPAFDFSHALAAVFAAGLVTAVILPTED